MAVYDELETPLGTLRVVMDSVGVSRVALTEEDWGEIQQEFHDLVRDPESCRDAVRQLEEYFSGRRRAFDVALSLPEDSPFRRRVWAALREIPYGQVRSYGEIAAAIGNPRAVRAVGQANRANPLPIFIPCHRVVGKKGDLVGYAGSRTDLKAHLLRLEGALAE
ncbi:MAG TPA: methylated-DNA--[protein]-cysteine S-methyltransferase [Alicyclobacillus sp.]|nr:methylated-DNA--[protein]-cysteine S-methyltransferase [Alicyclobacillus sp.]